MGDKTRMTQTQPQCRSHSGSSLYIWVLNLIFLCILSNGGRVRWPPTTLTYKLWIRLKWNIVYGCWTVPNSNQRVIESQSVSGLKDYSCRILFGKSSHLWGEYDYIKVSIPIRDGVSTPTLAYKGTLSYTLVNTVCHSLSHLFWHSLLIWPYIWHDK